MSNPFATPADLRRRLGTAPPAAPGMPAVDDVLLGEFLDAAAGRIVNELSDRTLFDQPDQAREFETRARRIPMPDLRAVTEVSIGSQVLPETGWRLVYPVRALGDDADRFLGLELGGWTGGPFSFDGSGDPFYDPIRDARAGRAVVTVTGDWGPESPDPQIVDAVLTWAARAFHQRAARFADSVVDPTGTFAGSYFRSIPNDVGVVINAYRVPGL